MVRAEGMRVQLPLPFPTPGPRASFSQFFSGLGRLIFPLEPVSTVSTSDHHQHTNTTSTGLSGISYLRQDVASIDFGKISN
jgi:hypothetical protein